ncbi:MAG: nitrous oxide reductase family maturation protein NosD [Promethearchaeota archaeon]
MQKKIVITSLILTTLALSIIVPIVAVSAKKPEYTSGAIYINDDIPSYSWEFWSAQPWLKGSGTEEDPYMIKDLTIEVSGSIFALMIANSGVYFKIMKCTFHNAGGEGTAALILLSTQNGVIFKNTFYGSNAGIALIGSENNVVQKNLCYENAVGIYNQWGMFNIIKQNNCKNNYNGIVIESAHKTIIEQNECTGNGLSGIALVTENEDNTPKDNLIYANRVENNLLGIYLGNADKNDIFRNTVAQNAIGIMFDVGSQENTVYHNNIMNNGMQSVDYQPTTNNWHHPFMLEGNYWSDYTGLDENEDGIGDTPRGYDGYPLMEKDGWDFYTPLEHEILNAFFNKINRLGADRTVNGSQTSYIIYGIIQLFSERMNGEAYPPYSMRINGDEVLDSVWYFQEESAFGEPGLAQYFYLKLPPNFLFDVIGLTPGYWEYFVELSWYMGEDLFIFSFWTGFYLVR